MSSSSPPLFPETDVFIPSYWRQASDNILTQDEADTRYLKFPIGQGTESIPNLIVAGSSTLGVVSTNTLNSNGLITANQGIISNDSSIFQTTGSGSSAIEIFSNIINGFSTGGNNMTLSMVDGFDFNNSTSQRQIFTDPNAGTSVYSNYISGNQQVPILTIGVETPNPTTTAVIKCEGDVSTPTTLLLKSFNPDDQYSYTNLITGDDLGTSPIASIGINDPLGVYSTSAYIEILNQTITFNIGILTFLTLSLGANFNNAIFGEPVGFSTDAGVIEQSVINSTTTGDTNLVFNSANAYRTIINTPTNGTRRFILPTTTGQQVGGWFAICNKSTAFTIAVCFPTTATTIFTIPVSPTGGAGSIAKFAIDNNSTAYFRAG